MRAGLQEGELISEFEQAIEFLALVGRQCSRAIPCEEFIQSGMAARREKTVRQGFEFPDAQTSEHF